MGEEHHYIYKCLRTDSRYVPPQYVLLHEAPTEEEAIEYLRTHGGGVYRNVLHRFDLWVEGE